MQALNDIRDRLVVLKEERGDLLSRIIAGVLIVACLAGAYMTGRRVERQWWRSEIAAKSATANNIMSKLDAEAPDHDERLIKEWVSHDLDTLRAAERRLAEAARAAQSKPAEAPDDPCKPLPAHCLRR